MKVFKSTIIFLLAVSMVNLVFATDKTNKSFGTRAGEVGWNQDADLNGDGMIDGYDLAFRSLDAGDQLADRAGSFRKDWILVRFAPRLTENEQKLAVRDLAGETSRLIHLESIDYKRVTVPEDLTAEQFLAKMKADPKVIAAQLDYICRVSRTPNDQYYSLQWNFEHVKAPRAWDLTLGGSSDVVVAVIDTGIAYENFGEYQIAPDMAGTAFAAGYDFINNDSHANDDEGHGTHVAGTIAQTTDNSIGASGLAYKTTLMPIKVLGSDGTGTSSALSQGIRWAADNGAKVINMSLGFPTGTTGGPAVADAVQYAYEKGVIMVGAAGNEGNDNGYNGGIEYPAAYDQVIAVGAIRYDKRYTNYSNYGSKITCVAPGGKVNFDQNNDGNSDGILQQTFINGNPTQFRYVFYEGTSQATPHVAAAAALFLSRRGGGYSEFMTAIRETSEDLGASGFDQRYGYGLIDIGKIVIRGHGWGAN